MWLMAEVFSLSVKRLDRGPLADRPLLAAIPGILARFGGAPVELIAARAGPVAHRWTPLWRQASRPA